MKTNVLKSFDINLTRLKNGKHHFQFELIPDFFETFENNLVKKGFGSASLVLDKSESMMTLNFTIKTEILLTCDISLKSYRESLTCKKKHIVKFGLTNEELSDEISTIDSAMQTLNVSSYIYEFVSLEIPMKKVHPNLRNQERAELAYKDETPSLNSQEKDNAVDPRWEALKKIKL
ncbi:MAG: hypothetical protein CMB82_06285 [Flammeovirgaceae bacterium]|nr:hypothetical protein [Flammeovirgaceae bacterium]